MEKRQGFARGAVRTFGSNVWCRENIEGVVESGLVCLLNIQFRWQRNLPKTALNSRKISLAPKVDLLENALQGSQNIPFHLTLFRNTEHRMGMGRAPGAGCRNPSEIPKAHFHKSDFRQPHGPALRQHDELISALSSRIYIHRERQ